jgi:hypothetical protein
VADVLKAAFLKHIGGKPAFLEYRIGGAVPHKLGKLFFYRFNGQVVENAILIPDLKSFQKFRQDFIGPFQHKIIQAALHAGGIRPVFLAEFHQQAWLVLVFQFPNISHDLAKALIAAVGVHQVKEVLQAGGRVAHVDNGDAFGLGIDTAADLIVPDIHVGKEAGVRSLHIDKDVFIEAVFIIPCHAGQQALPIVPAFCQFLDGFLIQVGEIGRSTQPMPPFRFRW